MSRDCKKAYVCGVAWQHEIGETDVTMYESARRCRKERGCTEECGIVEIEVRFKRWVKKQDLTKNVKKATKQFRAMKAALRDRVRS